MTITGEIVSEPTPDFRGDTLAADAAIGATSLLVTEMVDFDDDPDNTSPRWLVVGESAPMEYAAVDEDALTVTLVAPTTEAFEAGLPVTLWDPTVTGGGAKIVEYLAPVRLADGSGTVDAVIPHEKIPLNGIANLVGAQVGLAEDAGEWYVAQVYSRQAIVDQATIDVPFITLYRATGQSIPDSGDYTSIVNWQVQQTQAVDQFTVASGVVTIADAGLYLFTLAVNWAGNSSGRRYIQIVTTINGVDTILRTIPGAPPDALAMTQQIVVAYQAAAGESLRVEVRQTTGAALDIRGQTDGRLTALQIVRLQA